MNTFPRLWCLAALLCAATTTPGIAAERFVPLWQIGFEDNDDNEFVGESGSSNAAPGSSTLRDDDFYAGTETDATFERSLTVWDPENRVHFTLGAAQITDARLRLTVDFFTAQSNGTSFWGDHDLEIRINGGPPLVTHTVSHEQVLQFTFEPTNLVTGDNVIALRRTSASNGWLAFDHLSMELDAGGLADADADGMALWFEELYGFDDTVGTPADAALDADADGRTNLEEFNAGTNPRDADSDNDGASDAAEATAGTDPQLADSDGDTLSDGTELAAGLNPLATDSDSDGVPDGYAARFPAAASVSAHAIGVNFISAHHVRETSEPGAIPPLAIAGLLPQSHWNQNPMVRMWNSVSASLTDLTNSTGAATTTDLSYSGAYTFTAENVGSPELDLLGGYLVAGDTDASLAFTQIPFANYHALVYLGDNSRDRAARLRANGDITTDTHFYSDTASPFPGYKVQVAPVAAADAVRTSVVVFENLTGSTLDLLLNATNAGDDVGIHAVQLVDASADADGDSVSDYREFLAGTDPFVSDGGADPDGDGLTNTAELAAGTDPLHADTDLDEIDDAAEIALGTDPLKDDTDGDGLADGAELNAGIFSTDPTLADSDGDTFIDGDEIAARTDPNDATVTPAASAVPVYSAPGGVPTWNWTLDGVRLVWNHDENLRSPNEYNDSHLLYAGVRVETGGNSRSADGVDFGITSRSGSIVWWVSTRRGAWGRNGGGSDYYAAEWDGNPDFISDFGFSGYGANDISFPLRLSFTATRPGGANDWTLTWRFENVSNPAAPVLIHENTDDEFTATSTINDGSATWLSRFEEPGLTGFDTGPGVQAGMFALNAPAVADPDADNDGMDDAWETAQGVSDPDADPDGDGVINRREFAAGTDPNLADSDGDGADDGYELAQSSDPTSSASVPPLFNEPGLSGEDLDGDGMADLWQMQFGASGLIAGADDDGDGMSNADEAAAGTDPLDANSILIADWLDGAAVPTIEWPAISLKAYRAQVSNDLLGFTDLSSAMPAGYGGGMMTYPLTGETSPLRRFFRIESEDTDSDGDGLSDFTEDLLGTDPGVAGIPIGNSPDSPNSSGQTVLSSAGDSYSGDYRRFLETIRGGATHGGTAGSTTPGAPSRKSAARFLTQASFGPSLESIEELIALGPDAYETWIDAQLLSPMTSHREYIEEIRKDFFPELGGERLDLRYNHDRDNFNFLFGNNVTTPFARAALLGEDQLRQRVAFALSQILVISRQDAGLDNVPLGVSDYYDLLVEHAFGDYGELLNKVAMHPTMGWYLSHIGNQKADPSIPRFPDENFAREIMQLFTIGLWELNADGTRKLDGSGEPIPTYGNAEITELARVFTGLWYDVPYSFGNGGWDDTHYSKPMRLHPIYHDFGAKTLLNGFVIPARSPSMESGLQNIRDAVNHLAEHPNTGVYISRQLIQFLVTANPTPAYVGRISAVFADDGSGKRGNLGAVVKAILLDAEAREPSYYAALPSYGKLREPVLRTFALARAFEAGKNDPDFVWWNWDYAFYESAVQEPTFSPSVFNFYTPVYQAPGDIRDAGLVSPVFEITDTYTGISLPNQLWDHVSRGLWSSNEEVIPFEFSTARGIADDTEALLDHVDLLLCSGSMTPFIRDIIRDAIDTPGLNADERIALATYLAIASPDGAIQR